jgi:integrative and conjugative element protein (TIGR02256 family)
MALTAEADRTYLLETGGVFLGYWSEHGHEVVITEMVGPGPNAVLIVHDFIPDYAYQKRQIAEHYAASGRRYTYLGDWHTHPDTKQTRLSRKDRRSLGRIASSPDARNAVPLMGVFAGIPDNWAATTWKVERRRFGDFFSRTNPLSLVIWETTFEGKFEWLRQ